MSIWLLSTYLVTYFVSNQSWLLEGPIINSGNHDVTCLKFFPHKIFASRQDRPLASPPPTITLISHYFTTCFASRNLCSRHVSHQTPRDGAWMTSRNYHVVTTATTAALRCMTVMAVSPLLWAPWSSKFGHWVGFFHTNYKAYTCGHALAGFLAAPLLSGVNSLVVQADFHRVNFPHERVNGECSWQ